MIKEIIIHNWEDIYEYEFEGSCELYRGQSNINWELSTSLKRETKGTEFENDPTNVEFWCLREFKRNAVNYIDKTPDTDDILSWLGLMQHLGCATRLLDFTESFYIACHFALMNTTEDAVIWAVNSHWLHKIASNIFGISYDGLRDEWLDNTYIKANNYLIERLMYAETSKNCSPISGIVFIEPKILYRRLSSQQGVFLLQLDMTKSFMDNLSAHYDPDDIITGFKKFVLKKEMRGTALMQLKSMNINEETLFPGIDGFARSILQQNLLK